MGDFNHAGFYQPSTGEDTSAGDGGAAETDYGAFFAAITDRTGWTPSQIAELSLDQMLKGMVASGMPEARARPVVELYEYYLAGRGEGSDKVLRDLLGRKPRTIDAYLSEIAPLFAK